MPPEMNWEAGLLGKKSARQVDGGTLVGRLLREHGVKYLFAINGGHTWPILAALREHGVQLIHMRHEQACAYAADAYARITARPGVCSVTAGCGLTNAITGLCGAHLAGSAVVCIAGQHPTTEDHFGSFQEAYGADICRSFSKYVKRVVEWSTLEVDLRLAFREALMPPQGPALVEIPTNVLYSMDDPARQRRGARRYEIDEIRSAGDPAGIERALERLAGAARPLVVAGDGVFWSGAAAELREFVELTGIPVYTRRAGQGAVPEDHRLAVRGVFKKPFTGRADVVLAVGFKFWSGEHFGEAPTWNESAAYIQVDAAPSRIGWHVPAEIAIAGDPKLVLRQLIDGAGRFGLHVRPESAWADEVAAARAEYSRAIDAAERAVRGREPVHPDTLARAVCEVVDRDATVVIDSFTLSGWMSQWLEARFPGAVVDAGPLAPVGHGIGMGIGVQLARPGKQVVVVIGDGGLGIGGWDIETALRYGLPMVTVVWNNSSWGPGFEQMPILKDRCDPFSMLENVRYDRMFEVMGCHGEHVERPEQIRPALERALRSGKAAVINVVGDKLAGHPRLGGNLLGSTVAS